MSQISDLEELCIYPETCTITRNSFKYVYKES